jgi:5-(carboxyamino)imidazole ribonucleotide mutase
MPRGIPVATVAIGGAENAALLAAQIIGLRSAKIRQRVEQFRASQTQSVLDSQDDARLSPPFLTTRISKPSRRP